MRNNYFYFIQIASNNDYKIAKTLEGALKIIHSYGKRITKVRKSMQSRYCVEIDGGERLDCFIFKMNSPPSYSDFEAITIVYRNIMNLVSIPIAAYIGEGLEYADMCKMMGLEYKTFKGGI